MLFAEGAVLLEEAEEDAEEDVDELEGAVGGIAVPEAVTKVPDSSTSDSEEPSNFAAKAL